MANENNLMSTNGDDNKMDTSEVSSEDERKVFVGGLPQDASETELKTHFGKYGDIQAVSLKLDPSTGRSRGFAFVIFKAPEAVEATMAVEDHTVKGKKVAVKRAQAKQGKVYVGKLKPELTEEVLKEFFSQYGPVANLEQPMDKTKNEKKNFCFITFEKEEHAKKLLKEGSVTINSIEVEVKKVNQKQDMRGGFGARGGRGGHGPQGGWWPGGYGDYYGWGGYGGGDFYGGGGWGGWGFGPGGPVPFGGGGKTPRGGRGGARGRGARGMRSKPY